MPVSETTDTFRRPAWLSCVVGDQSARFKNTSSIRATGSVLWWWHSTETALRFVHGVCVCVCSSTRVCTISTRHGTFFLWENNRLFASTESWINFLCPQLRAELNLRSHTRTHTYDGLQALVGVPGGFGVTGRQQWRIHRVRGICSS